MTATLKLPTKLARHWLVWLEGESHGHGLVMGEITGWIRSQLQATKCKAEKKRPARQRRTEKKATRREAVAAVRAQVFERANGKCECGCGHEVRSDSLLFAPTLDHFFGGANRLALESVETCWLLAVRCHEQKTANFPSADRWLEKFIAHCMRQLGGGDREALEGYLEAAEMARARLSSRALQGDRT